MPPSYPARFGYPSRAGSISPPKNHGRLTQA